MASPSPVPHATDTAEIGRTGVRVTRLGLGGVALSGAPPATDPQRPTPEDEGVALIRRSLALGLTYLDTAPMYGVGQSEARYGRALRGVPRDSFVLSTKVGRVLRPGAPGEQEGVTEVTSREVRLHLPLVHPGADGLHPPLRTQLHQDGERLRHGLGVLIVRIVNEEDVHALEPQGAPARTRTWFSHNHVFANSIE